MNAAPKTLRHLSELRAAGLVPADRLAALEQVAAQYAVAVTPAMAELIDPADPHDPIARQFVPDAAELDRQPGETADPIGDHAHSPVEGVVHRYPDRALLKLTAICAVYCRFCFRREMIGPDAQPLSQDQLDAALAYIAEHTEIWEVILTGGDPLVLSPRRLKQVVARLAAIDHVKVIRVHTRIPVAEPSRVTPALVDALQSKRQGDLRGAARQSSARADAGGARSLRAPGRCRHPDAEPVGAARRRQRRSGDARRADARAGRVPHQALLPAPRRSRAGHVAPAHVDRARPGADAALRGRVSGLCQPSYVLDIPGGHGKSPIGPNYLCEEGAGPLSGRGLQRRLALYPPTA